MNMYSEVWKVPEYIFIICIQKYEKFLLLKKLYYRKTVVKWGQFMTFYGTNSEVNNPNATDISNKETPTPAIQESDNAIRQQLSANPKDTEKPHI